MLTKIASPDTVELPFLPDDALIDSLVAQSTPSDDTQFVNNTDGVRDPSGTYGLLLESMPAVEAAVGRRLAPNCTFVRVYRRGAKLGPHYDREGLDWTVSVTLRADALWSIEVAEPDGLRSIPTPVGEPVLMNGRKVSHCRENAYEGEETVVLLLHYREAAGATHMAVQGILSPADIQRLYSQINLSDLAAGTVRDTADMHPSRVSQVKWLGCPEWRWLYNKLVAAARANNPWNLPIGPKSEWIQFARYVRGGQYDWHQDRDDKNKRTVSIVVLLRQPTMGGGLELRDGMARMRPGDGCVFPSTEKHRAVSVIDGIRDSLTLWLQE